MRYRRTYRTERERSRLVMAAGIVAAAGIGFGLAFALPVPESLTEPAFQLEIQAAGHVYIADYGMTLSDCLARWDDFPPNVSIGCQRQ